MSSNQRTAYMLQIHKNPGQVNTFIQQLIVDGQADVFVHIDQRSYDMLKEQIMKSPHVTVLTESGICEWGDISQIDSTIRLLKAVLASGNDYDYVCLRSGQDLLVKNGFKDYLAENHAKLFMTLGKVGKFNLGFMEISWPKFVRKRYANFHPARLVRLLLLFCYRKGLNLFPNPHKLPKEYTIYKGSQWFTVPFETARYMACFLEENEWFYRFFEKALVPDQWFFQTLIMNSPYKMHVVDDNLLFLKWGETIRSQNSPQELTENDIGAIEESGHYFARKFDEKVDSDVIEYFARRVRFAGRKIALKDGEYVRL